MNNTILETLVNFNKERGLDKQDFDLRVASMNILEELLEAHGVHDNDDRELSKFMYKHIEEIVIDAVNGDFRDGIEYKKPTTHSVIDAFCDIQVYAFGEPLKIGYNPIQCLSETTTEICSRVGEIKNGKFVKDKSEEAQANWYKADFSRAKLEN